MEQNLLKISDLIIASANKGVLKKAVLSKPLDKSILKTVLGVKIISGKPALQAETFHKDNKATHKNLPLSNLNGEELVKTIVTANKEFNISLVPGTYTFKASFKGLKGHIATKETVVEVTEETKEIGYALIEKELEKIPREKTKEIAKQNIADIRDRNRRDFRF